MMILKTLSDGRHFFDTDTPPLLVNTGNESVYIVFFNVSSDIHITLEKDSKAIVYIFCTTHSSGKIEIFQEGMHSYLEVKGMYAPKVNALETTLDIRISGTHHTSHTRIVSMVEFGEVNVSGNLSIAEKSRNIDARLDLENIFLGENGKIHSLPNLFIKSNDVVAGHSSKTWRMNEETLFYLMSRGLARRDAQKLLENGYFQDIFGEIESGKREVYEKLREEFEGGER